MRQMVYSNHSTSSVFWYESTLKYFSRLKTTDYQGKKLNISFFFVYFRIIFYSKNQAIKFLFLSNLHFQPKNSLKIVNFSLLSKALFAFTTQETGVITVVSFQRYQLVVYISITR